MAEADAAAHVSRTHVAEPMLLVGV